MSAIVVFGGKCTLRVHFVYVSGGGECPVTPGDEGPEMPNAQKS